MCGSLLPLLLAALLNGCCILAKLHSLMVLSALPLTRVGTTVLPLPLLLLTADCVPLIKGVRHAMAVMRSEWLVRVRQGRIDLPAVLLLLLLKGVHSLTVPSTDPLAILQPQEGWCMRCAV
jgi:hypothetical protein